MQVPRLPQSRAGCSPGYLRAPWSIRDVLILEAHVVVWFPRKSKKEASGAGLASEWEG